MAATIKVSLCPSQKNKIYIYIYIQKMLVPKKRSFFFIKKWLNGTKKNQKAEIQKQLHQNNITPPFFFKNQNSESLKKKLNSHCISTKRCLPPGVQRVASMLRSALRCACAAAKAAPSAARRAAPAATRGSWLASWVGRATVHGMVKVIKKIGKKG